MKRIHPLVWILLLALGVRLIGLAARPIWYDEAFSMLFTARGPAAMLQGTLATNSTGAAEEHPLGYYFLFWGFLKVFGQSIIAARTFSILAGVITVGAIYYLARAPGSERMARLAAVFVALAPFQVHYSQEIRMYGWLTAWLALATLAFVRARQTHRIRWWVVFTLTAAAAQYTHSLAAFYLASLAATALFTSDWKFIRAVLLSGGAALVLYLPWLIHLPAQFAKISGGYWTEPPGLARVFTTLLSFVTNLPLPDAWLPLALGLTLLVITLAGWQTWQAFRLRLDTWQHGGWLLFLAILPPALLFLFSQWRPIYIERALLPSGALFCIWLAWSLTETRLPNPIRTALLGALAVAAALGLYQHISYKGFPYVPYQALATISENYQSGDVVIHSSKLTLLPMEVYDPNLPQLFIADPIGSNVDTLAPATQQILGVTSAPDIESAANHAPRVWLVIFKNSIAEYEEAGYETHPHVTWLQSHYQLVTTSEWEDLLVYQFEKPSTP